MTGWYRWDGKYVPPIANAPKVKPPIVSQKNKDYRDTYDELERIYQEVEAEAGRRSPVLPHYVSEPETPFAETYQWQVYKVPEGPPKKPGGLREFLITQQPWTEPPVPEEPVPAGVTLDELFAEDDE